MILTEPATRPFLRKAELPAHEVESDGNLVKYIPGPRAVWAQQRCRQESPAGVLGGVVLPHRREVRGVDLPTMMLIALAEQGGSWGALVRRFVPLAVLGIPALLLSVRFGSRKAWTAADADAMLT